MFLELFRKAKEPASACELGAENSLRVGRSKRVRDGSPLNGCRKRWSRLESSASADRGPRKRQGVARSNRSQAGWREVDDADRQLVKINGVADSAGTIEAFEADGAEAIRGGRAVRDASEETAIEEKL